MRRVRSTDSQQLNVTFEDLSYAVSSENRHLLQHITGYLQPKRLTALLGPSGSGKTTLLDILAGRKTTGVVTGDIKYGGQAVDAKFLSRCTGYVEQFDCLISSLTVREMLCYTAELKRPWSESYSSKCSKVDTTLSSLGLDVCKHVRIGDPLNKGISGGQAKRTNIGIALITDPIVLFLDEPTSGLDSYSADEVVALIKQLSLQGVTIAATIHAPSAAAFAMFDRILLLISGRVCYFGDNANDHPLLFARAHWPGAADVSLVDCSHAEVLLNLVMAADRQGLSQQLADAYEGSELRQENQQALLALLHNDSEEDTSEDVEQDTGAAAAAAAATFVEHSWAKSGTSITQMPYDVIGPSDMTVILSDTCNDDSPNTSVSQHGMPRGVALTTIFSSNSNMPGKQTLADDGLKALSPGLDPQESKATVLITCGDTPPETPVTNGRRYLRRRGTIFKPGQAGGVSASIKMKMNMDAAVAPWWWAVMILLKYRARVNYTQMRWLIPRIVDKLFFVFITTTLYLQTGNDFSSDQLVNLTSALFLTAVLPMYGSVAYLPSVVLERQLFYRERADGLYTVASYIVAKILEESLITVCVSIIASVIIFYGVAYEGSVALFWLVCMMQLLNGMAVGYVIAALSPTMEIANAALPGYVTLAVYMTGYVATFRTIPKYWSWYTWLTPNRHAWAALMLNQFENHDPAFGPDGKTVLQYYGIDGQNKWTSMGVLFIFYAVFIFIAFLGLSYIRFTKR